MTAATITTKTSIYPCVLYVYSVRYSVLSSSSFSVWASICIFSFALSAKQKKNKRRVLHPNAKYMFYRFLFVFFFFERLLMSFALSFFALWTTIIDYIFCRNPLALVNPNQIKYSYCYWYCYYTIKSTPCQICLRFMFQLALSWIFDSFLTLIGCHILYVFLRVFITSIQFYSELICVMHYVWR